MSQEPQRNRTTLVLLSLGVLDVVYIAMRLWLANTLPLAGVIAGAAFVIALVRVRRAPRADRLMVTGPAEAGPHDR